MDGLCLDDSFRKFMKDFNNQDHATVYDSFYRI